MAYNYMFYYLSDIKNGKKWGNPKVELPRKK